MKDGDNFQLLPLTDGSSVRLSLVHLFMPIGLISLFLTFLILPFLSKFVHLLLVPRVTKHTLQAAELSLVSTASLVAGFSIIYWIISLMFYYCHFSETVDGALFTNAFFSPMTQCVIFYNLAGLASFIGGMLFSRCMTAAKAHITCCQVMGKGLLSACTTAGFFHSFFIILALFEDPVSTISNIITLTTVVVLLFLALFAMLEQYRRSRFHGNFILVVMMQMTLSSIYNILVMSFRQITTEGEAATGSYLCLVIVISTSCILLAVAMIVMMANAKNGKKNACNLKKVENGNNPKERSGLGEGGGSGGMQLAARSTASPADLAAVAREMGFVVLIPGVVQAWQRRSKDDDEITTSA